MDIKLFNGRLPRIPKTVWTFVTTSLWILFIINLLILGYLVQQLFGVPGLVITQYGFILLPCVFYVRVASLNPVNVLRLKRASMRTLGAAVFLIIPTILFSLSLLAVQETIRPPSEELVRGFKEIMEQASGSLWLKIVILGITPGICEEVLFRGVLLYRLERVFGSWLSILLNGLIFGALHLSPYRFPATAVLGMVLCHVTLKSDSIFPAMILHSGYNTVLVIGSGLVGVEGTNLTKTPMSLQFLPFLFLFMAAALLLLLLGLKWIKRKPISIRCGS